MTLSIGTQLAHYEILSQLGKGGMGEVYKGKDQKLGRDVAIKVLPEEFAKDADRVARFQREAKLLASLNHPNIAAIYGLEESDGTHFLVLELIEGDTLADRLKRGAIPVEESLKLALQIAEALEAAHEKGVIHRDLKPANIKITPDGKVKVLDFGLAKAFAGEQAEVNLSHSPTLSDMATQQGLILGTAAYMSPEQARGKPVDKRTDIWAFSCVLYEMLTGKAAFQGEDVTEILAAVVKSGVNLDLLPANIHPRVREVIIRCLQKEQKKRYRDIGEAQYEIEQVLADPSGVFVQPTAGEESKRKLRQELPWIAAIVIISIVIGGMVVWYVKPTPSPELKRVMRFEYELPEDQHLRILGSKPILAISPDDSQIVYGTTKGLYIRYMDELEARIIPGTNEISQAPFFAPDGKWIGYWSESDNQLKKIAVGGGTPIPLTKDPSVGYLNWNLDNKILYAYGENILQISADGGNPESLIELKGYLMESPQLLPDGESVLFTKDSITTVEIMLYSLKSRESKVLIRGGRKARYLKTGHIVYVENNNLFAVPFEIDTLQITGGALPLVDNVANFSYAISNSGTLVYLSESADATNRRLVWVDRNGKEESLYAPPDAYTYIKISPDGTKGPRKNNYSQ
jgi:serine/threonine protein kinase